MLEFIFALITVVSSFKINDMLTVNTGAGDKYWQAGAKYMYRVRANNWCKVQCHLPSMFETESLGSCNPRREFSLFPQLAEIRWPRAAEILVPG